MWKRSKSQITTICKTSRGENPRAFFLERMPKHYPGFIIDRCRQIIDGQAYDFVVSTDKTVGFVARAYSVRRAGADAVNAYIASKKDADVRFCVVNYERFSVVLEIVEFLQSPALDSQERARVRSLLKKAARKYMIYVSKSESPIDDDGASLENQLKAVRDVVATAESQYASIANNMGEARARLYIESLRAAVRSLELLKSIQTIRA